MATAMSLERSPKIRVRSAASCTRDPLAHRILGARDARALVFPLVADIGQFELNRVRDRGLPAAAAHASGEVRVDNGVPDKEPIGHLHIEANLSTRLQPPVG